MKPRQIEQVKKLVELITDYQLVTDKCLSFSFSANANCFTWNATPSKELYTELLMSEVSFIKPEFNEQQFQELYNNTKEKLNHVVALEWKPEMVEVRMSFAKASELGLV